MNRSCYFQFRRIAHFHKMAWRIPINLLSAKKTFSWRKKNAYFRDLLQLISLYSLFFRFSSSWSFAFTCSLVMSLISTIDPFYMYASDSIFSSLSLNRTKFLSNPKSKSVWSTEIHLFGFEAPGVASKINSRIIYWINSSNILFVRCVHLKISSIFPYWYAWMHFPSSSNHIHMNSYV